MSVKAESTISLASVKTVNDSATYARQKALEAETSAQEAKDALQSVVQGATTVEKAVSVMQTALEAVVDYDPDTDTTTEYFWHDANGAHVLGDTSGYRNDIDSTGMHIIDIATENEIASFGVETSIYTADGTELAHFGYDEGNASSGTATKPYYVMGVNKPSAEYSETTAYNLGDTCIYNGQRYVCIAEDGVAGEEFDSTKWALAIGNYSFMSGWQSEASGTYSHVEGFNNSAVGKASHAEGGNVIAFGNASHAEGSETIASARQSHAQNLGTVADQQAQTAIGKYNTEGNTNNLFVVGNGTSNTARSDAFTVDSSGNVVASGGLTLNGSEAMADFIVETGTSGIWTYRKWASGIAECWGHFGTTSTSNGAWSTNFPTGLFVSTPYVAQTLWYGEDANRGARAIILSDGSNTTQLVTYLRTYSGGAYSGNFAIQVLAKGKWK